MSAEDQRDIQSAKPSRPRPVLSCLECRRKKLKCDRLLPCQQCLKLNHPSACVYAPGQEPELRASTQPPVSAAKRARRDTSVESSCTALNTIDDLHERVRTLEEALKLQATGSCPSPYTAPANLSGLNTPFSNDTSDAGTCFAPFDDGFSIFDKFRDARQFIQAIRERQDDAQLSDISKQLHAVKNAIIRPLTSTPTALTAYENVEELVHYMLQFLPALPVRKKLVEHYFENFEHCTRLLHIPNFLLHHRQFNQGALDWIQSEYFIPTLLGVLCTASCLNTYPECDLSGLHGIENSLNVIHLLNRWYELVIERDGLTIPAIQVKLLGLRIQRYHNTNVQARWASSAMLVRQAMTVGLHKEPPQCMNNHDAEIRRCIWLAILEQDLALSIACEMPPLCPPYTLRYPANCDDNELSDTSATNPPDYPTHQWTDGLCVHIMGKTFNRRLEAYKHRFSERCASHYAETLEHARRLETILRELPPLFRLDHISNTPSRLMAQMELDISLRRPLIATYAPYARATPVKDMYREVRVPWVQSHLIVMCFQDLFDPQFDGIDVPRPVGYWDFYWAAYNHDNLQSAEAMLVEGHYLKSLKTNQSVGNNSENNRTHEDSPVRVRRWDFDAILKSIEDTLGPMSRHVGPFKGYLRDVFRYRMLYDCLRAPANEDVYSYVVEGLEGVTSSIRTRLDREGFITQTVGEPQPSMESDAEWLADFLSLKDMGHRPSQPF